MPSDASLGYPDRTHRMPRYPSRGPSPVYYQAPNGDVPPVPLLHQYYHPAVEQVRHLNRSIKGSVSSGSTNMRTDSDTPSSDMPQPQTPRDGMSMNVLATPQGNRIRRGTTTRDMKEPVSSGPMYYDYTEQFERDEFAESEPEPMPTGFVNNVKAAVEERSHSVAPHKATTVSSVDQSEIPGVAELPASPVGRRITKELVRQLLESSSTISDTAPSTISSTVKDDTKNDHHSQEQTTTSPVEEELSRSSELPARTDEQRHSILSQTGSSVLNSSTLEFAARYSIPAITGTGTNIGTQPDSKSTSTSPGSPNKSTGDGMSELLAGYQHTDSKQEGVISPKPDTMHKTESSAANSFENNSSHIDRPSDEQSFKSCTDVPEPVSSVPAMSKPGKENAPAEKFVNEASPDTPLHAKDSDARSFQTCKDIITPGGANSMPQSGLPTPSLNTDTDDKRAAASLPLSSPLPTLRKAAVTNKSSSSIASRFRKSSKPSVKQGSASISGSSSTLSTPQQPLSVPPRESSVSSEAQRLNAVGSFLMRHVVPSRFSKGKKGPSDDEDKVVKSSMDTTTSQPLQQKENSSEPVAISEKCPNVEEVPKGALARQSVQEERSNEQAEHDSPTQDLHVNLVRIPALHYHSFSSPSTAFPETSSIYSPQDASLKSRAQSSSADIPLLPEHGRRDSHTTTHLSWAGRKPFGVLSTSASEPRLPLPSVQEDTTTNLRLSVYKYNAPQRYLHDLKEDSHEDSSLNTSASNLKNSHFRFPHGSGFGIRTSVDGVIVRKESFVDDALGLPALEFSQGNLFEKFKDALADVRFSRSSGRPHFEVTDAGEGSPQVSMLDRSDCLQAREPVHVVNLESRVTESTQSTGLITFARLSREGLIEEIDRVSIPSITQLTQRVTEMLPSLSLLGQQGRTESRENGEFPEEEGIMEQAMEEIHHVHPPTQKRSSARLRPIRGSSALLIMDDDVYEEITSKEKGSGMSGEQSVGTSEFEIGGGEAGTRAKGKGKTITNTPTRQLAPVAELRAPSPAVLRADTRRTKSVQALRTSVESVLSFTGSPRSFISTPAATDTRPWNFDKNYPWATTTNPSVDISLPLPVAQKQSPRPGPSHLRNTLSDATTSTFTSVCTPIDSSTGNTSGSNANRQSHRLSIFGRSGDQAHVVGERYPTSALSPPTAIFRDHLSTCDTSDDEDYTASRKSNKLTLRKRFSSAARSNTLSHSTPRAARSKVNPTELASPASIHEDCSSTLQDRAGEARVFTSNRHTFRDAEGMRISAYHRHRIVDSIKRWWHKGGELIRTISRRGNYHRQDVSDSVRH
jgi:serine/arginine repetitive matrix protein 2